MAIPLCPDLFHLLQDASPLTRRLEGTAYKAMETAKRARRVALEVQGIIRRRGPHLKVKTPLPQAQTEEAQVIALFDVWCWLVGEIRQALDPLTPVDGLVSVAALQTTLETALTLLKGLGRPEITAFADALQELPQLLAPLEWLEQQLQPVLQDVDAEPQAFIL